MDKLELFLENLHERLTVIKNEEIDLVEWYRTTRNHFRDYHGVNHPSTIDFADIVRDCEIALMRAPAEKRTRTEDMQRIKAIYVLQRTIIFHTIGE